MAQITIKHENQNGSEYGYGLYINAYITSGPYADKQVVWASECVKKDSSESDIKKAEKRVRSRARYAYKKELES
jgi:hypothetical protein